MGILLYSVAFGIVPFVKHKSFFEKPHITDLSNTSNHFSMTQPDSRLEDSAQMYGCQGNSKNEPLFISER